MKRILSLALVLVLMFSLAVPAAAATTENVDITYRAIRIVLDGEEITPCDANGNGVEPFIMKATGTTYLPLRAIGQALGLNVAWDGATSTVTLTSGGAVLTGKDAPLASNETKNVEITYRDIKVVLDGVQLELVNANGEKVEPFIMNGTTYLPLRVVSEALELDVAWDAATSTVGLTQPDDTPDHAEGYWMQSKETTVRTYTDGSTDTEVSEFDYDANGYVTLESYRSGSYWYKHSYTYHSDYSTKSYSYTDSNGSESSYSYDENGNVLSYKEADGMDLNIYGTCSYDSQGRLIKQVHSDANSAEGYDYSYTSTYSYSGNTTYEVTKYADGYVSETATVASYDARGNLIRETATSADGYVICTDYTYDSQDRLISVKTSDEYSVFYQVTIGYDAYGYENYFKESYDDGSFTELKSTYDANGNVLKEIYTDSDGYSYTDTCTYNSYGDCIKHVYTDSDGYNYSDETYFDADGNYIGFRYENEIGVHQFRYTLDENGMAVSSVEDYVDERTTLTYTYDENGNMIAGKGATYVQDSSGQYNDKICDVAVSYEYEFFPF